MNHSDVCTGCSNLAQRVRKSRRYDDPQSNEAPNLEEDLLLNAKANLSPRENNGIMIGRIPRNIRQSIAYGVNFKHLNSKIVGLRNHYHHQSQQGKSSRRVRFDETRNQVHKQKHKSVGSSRTFWYTREEIGSFKARKMACFENTAAKTVPQKMNRFATVLSHIYVACFSREAQDNIQALVEELTQFFLDFPCMDEYWGLETKLMPGFETQNQDHRDQMLFELRQLRQNDDSNSESDDEDDQISRNLPSEHINGPAQLFAHIVASAHAEVNRLPSSSKPKCHCCLASHF